MLARKRVGYSLIVLLYDCPISIAKPYNPPYLPYPRTCTIPYSSVSLHPYTFVHVFV